MGTPTIELAATEADIAAGFPVVHELRGHLDREQFLRRVVLQQRQGYRLALLRDAGEVRAAAGYRMLDNLVSGRVLYVDDLVTAAAHRSRGYGAALMAWLVDQARTAGCDTLELDSGVQRFAAHRFYLLQRMDITSHHFRLRLRD